MCFQLSLLKLYSCSNLKCFFSYEGRDCRIKWGMMFSYNHLTPSRQGLRRRCIKACSGMIVFTRQWQLSAFLHFLCLDLVILYNVLCVQQLNCFITQQWINSFLSFLVPGNKLIQPQVTTFRYCEKNAMELCQRSTEFRKSVG